MAFWQTTLQRLGIGGGRKTKAALRGRVEMPVGSSGVNSSSVIRYTSGGLAFWGDNVEGYDTLLSGGQFDYEGAIGLYQDNSAVAACLSFIISAFSACTLQVGRMDGSEFVADASHPLLDLLNQPMQDCDGLWLWALMISDYWEHGNAYWNIVRSGLTGPPVEIQPLDASVTAPVRLSADPARLLDHYRYQPSGRVQDVPAEQVLHFRYSIPDPDDMRVGVRPLRSVRREVYTDNKSSEVAAAIMRSPKPSGFLSPESSDVEVDPDDLRNVKAQLTEAGSGQNAGQVVALAAAVKFTPLTFKPNELALDEARRKPEERICALFNIPPVVVGLGAGLDKSTYNNGETAHRAAWVNCIAPLQDYFASVLTSKLLPMFPGSEGKVVAWDRSQVGVLQPDINAQRKEAREDFKLGLISAEEARAEGGRTGGAPTATAPTSTPDPAAKSYGLKRGVGGGSVYDAADRFRAALMDDEQDALSELASAYNRVSRDLQKQIDELLSEMEQGDLTQEAMLARATALAEQVELALRGFADRGAVIIENGQRRMIATTQGHTEALTRSALGTPPPGVSVAFNQLPAEALEVLIGMASNGSPVEALLQQAGREFAVELREILISSLAQGIGPREAGRRMAGASGANRARMETIARTEMLRASREATRRTYEANPNVIEGYVRLSAADTRTCAACWALHGTKSSTAERFAQHPNCRCTLVPAVKSYAEILGDLSIPDTRKPIPSGEDVFSRLSTEEQAQVLGPGLFALYQGGAKLTDFVTRTFDPEWGPTVTVSTVASATVRAEVFS